MSGSAEGDGLGGKGGGQQPASGPVTTVFAVPQGTSGQQAQGQQEEVYSFQINNCNIVARLLPPAQSQEAPQQLQAQTVMGGAQPLVVQQLPGPGGETPRIIIQQPQMQSQMQPVPLMFSPQQQGQPLQISLQVPQVQGGQSQVDHAEQAALAVTRQLFGQQFQVQGAAPMHQPMPAAQLQQFHSVMPQQPAHQLPALAQEFSLPQPHHQIAHQVQMPAQAQPFGQPQMIVLGSHHPAYASLAQQVPAHPPQPQPHLTAFAAGGKGTEPSDEDAASNSYGTNRKFRLDAMRLEKLRGRERRSETKALMDRLDLLVPCHRQPVLGKRRRNLTLKKGRMILELFEDTKREISIHLRREQQAVASSSKGDQDPHKHSSVVTSDLFVQGLLESRVVGACALNLPTCTVAVWNTAMQYHYLPINQVEGQSLGMVCSPSSSAALQKAVKEKRPEQYRGAKYVALDQPLELQVLHQSARSLSSKPRPAIVVTRPLMVGGVTFHKSEEGKEVVVIVEPALPAPEAKDVAGDEMDTWSKFSGEFAFGDFKEKKGCGPIDTVVHLRQRKYNLEGYVNDKQLAGESTTEFLSSKNMSDREFLKLMRFHVQITKVQNTLWYQLHWCLELPKGDGNKRTSWTMAMDRPCDGVLHRIGTGKLGYSICLVHDLSLSPEPGLQATLVSYHSEEEPNQRQDSTTPSNAASNGSSDTTSGTSSPAHADAQQQKYAILFRRFYYLQRGGVVVHSICQNGSEGFPNSSKWTLKKTGEVDQSLMRASKEELRVQFMGFPYHPAGGDES